MEKKISKWQFGQLKLLKNYFFVENDVIILFNI